MSGSDVRERLERYVANHPRASVFDVLANTDVAPSKYRSLAEALVEGIAEVRKRLESDGNLEVDDGSSGTGSWMVTVGGGPPAGGRAPPASAGAAGYRTAKRQRSSAGRAETNPEQSESESDSADREGCVGLLVSARCQHLIREFLGYKEEHVGKSQAVDHCLDSLRYACMGAAGNSRSSKASGVGVF